jgi:hypothetical protein
MRMAKDWHDCLVEYCEKTGRTPSEMVEHGLVRLMLEDSAAPPETRLLRFLVGKIPPAKVRELEAAYSYLCANDLSPSEMAHREYVLRVLDLWRADPRCREELIRVAGEKHMDVIIQL